MTRDHTKFNTGLKRQYSSEDSSNSGISSNIRNYTKFFTPTLARQMVNKRKNKSSTNLSRLNPTGPGSSGRGGVAEGEGEGVFGKFNTYVVGILIFAFIGWLSSIIVVFLHSSTDELKSHNKHNRRIGENGLIVGKVIKETEYITILGCIFTTIVGIGYKLLDNWFGIVTEFDMDALVLIRSIGCFFGINYAFFKIEFQSMAQAYFITIAITVANWAYFDSSVQGILFSGSMSLIGTVILYIMNLTRKAAAATVATGTTNLSSLNSIKDDIDLLLYLPALLFSYCILLGVMGRLIFKST